jgi:hypothetical protein
MFDGPGFDTGSASPGPGTCTTENEIVLACNNFRTWVEADGQQCSPFFNWFASTRIKCSNTTWVVDNTGPGNTAGPGSIDCAVPANVVSAAMSSVSSVVQLLESTDAADRLTGFNAVLSVYSSDQLKGAEREQLVSELLRIASRHSTNYDLYSSEMLAIDLLGVLQVKEAIPILMKHILTEFPRPRIGQRKSQLSTEASIALSNLGGAVIPAIIQKARSASNQEWRILEQVLRLFEDQRTLRQAICAALDSDPGKRAEKRLDRFLKGEQVLGLQ